MPLNLPPTHSLFTAFQPPQVVVANYPTVLQLTGNDVGTFDTDTQALQVRTSARDLPHRNSSDIRAIRCLYTQHMMLTNFVHFNLLHFVPRPNIHHIVTANISNYSDSIISHVSTLLFSARNTWFQILHGKVATCEQPHKRHPTEHSPLCGPCRSTSSGALPTLETENTSSFPAPTNWQSADTHTLFTSRLVLPASPIKSILPFSTSVSTLTASPMSFSLLYPCSKSLLAFNRPSSPPITAKLFSSTLRSSPPMLSLPLLDPSPTWMLN
ncbi:hypothetical protein MBANPS3_006026 [Mucor bainieri]